MIKNFKLKRLTKEYEKICAEIICCTNSFFHSEWKMVVPSERSIPLLEELLTNLHEQLPLMKQRYAQSKTLPLTEENNLNTVHYELAIGRCDDWIDYIEGTTSSYSLHRNEMTIKDFMMSNGVCLGQIKLHIDNLNKILSKIRKADAKLDLNTIFYSKEKIDKTYRAFSHEGYMQQIAFINKLLCGDTDIYLTDDFNVVIKDTFMLHKKLPNEVNALFREVEKYQMPLDHNEPTSEIIDFIYNAVRGETTEFPYPERYQKEPVFRKCLFEGMTQEDLDYLNRHRANDPMFK